MICASITIILSEDEPDVGDVIDAHVVDLTVIREGELLQDGRNPIRVEALSRSALKFEPAERMGPLIRVFTSPLEDVTNG